MSKLSRRDLIKTTALGGFGAALSGMTGCSTAAGTRGRNVKLASGIALRGDLGQTRPRPAGQKPVHDLQTRPLQKVRTCYIGLNRGLTHVQAALKLDFVEVVAVCDLVQKRADRAAAACEKAAGKRPAIYGGTEDIWEKMLDRDDIDAVYI